MCSAFLVCWVACCRRNVRQAALKPSSECHSALTLLEVAGAHSMRRPGVALAWRRGGCAAVAGSPSLVHDFRAKSIVHRGSTKERGSPLTLSLHKRSVLGLETSFFYDDGMFHLFLFLFWHCRVLQYILLSIFGLFRIEIIQIFKWENINGDVDEK